MTQFPSITEFDRKHLAPKKRVAPVAKKISFDFSDALFFFQIAAFVIVVAFALDAGGYLLWSISGQIPADGFYAGALTAKLIALF